MTAPETLNFLEKNSFVQLFRISCQAEDAAFKVWHDLQLHPELLAHDASCCSAQ